MDDRILKNIAKVYIKGKMRVILEDYLKATIISGYLI